MTSIMTFSLAVSERWQKDLKQTNEKTLQNKSKTKTKKTHKEPKKQSWIIVFFLFFVFFCFCFFLQFFFCFVLFFFFGNFIFLVCSSICLAVAFIRLVCQFHVGMCWWIALWNSVWTICEVNQCISDLGLPSTVGISCFFPSKPGFLIWPGTTSSPKNGDWGAVDTSNPWLHPSNLTLDTQQFLPWKKCISF